MSQLRMRLAKPTPVLDLILPGGYSLEVAQSDQAAQIASLLQKSFPEMVWDAGRATRELFDDPSVTRTFVVTVNGAMAATASARNLPGLPDHIGYVHWVGADPAHKGKRLGSLVTQAVLNEFLTQEKTESYLDTDDFRLPAINVYLKLGYMPLIVDGTHLERWKVVYDSLGRDSADLG